MKKYISALFFLFLAFASFGQEEVALSRQDSANVNKFLRASLQQDSLGHLRESCDYLNRTALIFWEHNHFNEAIKYYSKSIEGNEKLRNENALAMIHSNLALIYTDLGDYDAALNYFRKTLAVRKANKERVGTISALINMSVVLNNLNRYGESSKLLTEALDIAREMNDEKQMCSCYGMLSQTCDKAGDTKKSLHYFELYRTFHEMIQGKKVAKSRDEAENQRLKALLAESEKQKKEFELYKKKIELTEKKEELAVSDSTNKSLLQNLSRQELEMKVLETKAENETLIAKHEVEKRKKALFLFVVIGIFVAIILLILYFAYRSKYHDNIELALKNEEINQQKEEILAQHEGLLEANEEIQHQSNKIKGSINYAKLIQTAMLNKREGINSFVSESFILFMPRDVVSGDFYWYAKIGDEIVFAAVDCTGHGVPGAFISMVGNELLNRIVKTEKIISPAEILYEMDKGIQYAFNQHDTENGDGMDMAICVLNKKKKKIKFSGAKNPLVLIRDNKLTFQKGSRYSIGGLEIRKRKKVFEEHEFDITDNSSFYLFSDGFQDQFGTESKTKIGIRRMRELLFKIKYKTMEEQKKVLEELFVDWKGFEKQIDDVLIIGVRV